MTRYLALSSLVITLLVPEAIAQVDPRGSTNNQRVGIVTATRFAGRRRARLTKDGRDMAKRFRLDAAMVWLKSNQNADGSFGGEGASPLHDIGLTGLALLAFLGEGSTMRSGPYKNQVKRAVVWLRRQINADGTCTSARSAGALLDHTIAAYGIAEAYGLSKYKTIKKNVTATAGYVRKQDDTNPQQLGWEMLLHHTLLEFDLEGFPDRMRATLKTALAMGSKKSQQSGLRQPVAILAGFIGPNARPLPKGSRNKSTPDTATLLAAAGKGLAKSDADESFWDFATLAMRANGGPDAEQWHRMLGKSIEATHHEDGSWGPRAGGKGKAGKIYSTAMTVLILQSAFDERVPDLPKPASRPAIKRR